MILLFIFTNLVFAAGEPIRYDLSNLRPKEISQYDGDEPGSLRQFLKFENSQGTHTFIYEEVNALPALKELASLRQMIGHWDSACEIQLDCTAKAYCTGDCHNMYYEFSNAQILAPDRNRCQLRFLSCVKAEPAPLAASLPAAQATVAPTAVTTPPAAAATTVDPLKIPE